MTDRWGTVICNVTDSADRYVAGPGQTEERPFGGEELRLHVVPLTLGDGARLFEAVPPLELEQVRSRAASTVTHPTYRVQS